MSVVCVYEQYDGLCTTRLHQKSLLCTARADGVQEKSIMLLIVFRSGTQYAPGTRYLRFNGCSLQATFPNIQFLDPPEPVVQVTQSLGDHWNFS